jgi:hypothetical protein
MNSTEDMQSILDKLIIASTQPDVKLYGSGLWKLCHQLAEAKFLPALDFFILSLENPRWDWREVSVSLLGFHYDLDPQVINKIRHLLIQDPESGVRIAAASVLGKQGIYPEKTLIDALKSDPNEFVKRAAFSSLLELAGVPYKSKVKALKKVQIGEITPNLEQVRQILSEENLLSSRELLEKD